MFSTILTIKSHLSPPRRAPSKRLSHDKTTISESFVNILAVIFRATTVAAKININDIGLVTKRLQPNIDDKISATNAPK